MTRLLLVCALVAGCGGSAVTGGPPPVDIVPHDDADLGSAPPAADLAPSPSPPDLATPPPPAKKVLDVQWQGQQTYYWCGPGSTHMALTTRLANNAPSQQSLADFMGTTTDGTDDISLVRNALNHYLGTSRYVATYLPDPPSPAQRDTLRHDVVDDIAHGWPLVANVVSGWRPPGYPGGTIYHYVAIVGYDENGALVEIADPAGDGAGGASWTNVPRTYWISVDDLGTWIGAKGYAR